MIRRSKEKELLLMEDWLLRHLFFKYETNNALNLFLAMLVAYLDAIGNIYVLLDVHMSLFHGRPRLITVTFINTLRSIKMALRNINFVKKELG